MAAERRADVTWQGRPDGAGPGRSTASGAGAFGPLDVTLGVARRGAGRARRARRS